MAIRADKREVTKAASVLAKASWMRNPQRKALVENKKKREGNKEERRQQVKKMMKAVDKRRAGDRLKALPKAKAPPKAPPRQKKNARKAPAAASTDDTVPAKRQPKKKVNTGNRGNLRKNRFEGIYNQ